MPSSPTLTSTPSTVLHPAPSGSLVSFSAMPTPLLSLPPQSARLRSKRGSVMFFALRWGGCGTGWDNDNNGNGSDGSNINNIVAPSKYFAAKLGSGAGRIFQTPALMVARSLSLPPLSNCRSAVVSLSGRPKVWCHHSGAPQQD